MVLALLVSAAGVSAAEPPATPAPAMGEALTNQDALRAYLQLQEQLHATQLAIERNRKEADAAATENARHFTSRLQGIEQALAKQRAQELEVMQSSNRAMLFVAGLFAALGFLAILFMAYFQWRTVCRLTEISATLPTAHTLGMGLPPAALGAGDGHVVSVGPAEQSNQRLLGALEQLEKRIHELEHLPQPSLAELTSAPVPGVPSDGESAEALAADSESARIAMLLGKGQSLLNLEKPEEALACFDEALAINDQHAEALVKKGAALEKMRKAEEAIACYDRAIAADSALTVAYLYKAGLFNQMERFDEALQCYEKALHTHEVRRG